jgi:hypothetical protein
MVCWVIWKARNETCFEKKPIKSPNEVMFLVLVFLLHWVGIYLEDMRLMID